MKQIASWLESLNADAMPEEIHLSNNQITAEGFDALFEALENKRGELSESALPVWCRVENNPIPTERIEELEKAGKVVKVGHLKDRKGGEHIIKCFLRTTNNPAAAEAIMAMPTFVSTAGYAGAKGGGGGNVWPQRQEVRPQARPQAVPWMQGAYNPWGMPQFGCGAARMMQQPMGACGAPYSAFSSGCKGAAAARPAPMALRTHQPPPSQSLKVQQQQQQQRPQMQ